MAFGALNIWLWLRLRLVRFSYRMAASAQLGCGSDWLEALFSFWFNLYCWSILHMVGPKHGLVSIGANAFLFSLSLYFHWKFYFFQILQATTRKTNHVAGIVPYCRPLSFNTLFPSPASYFCTSTTVALWTTSSSHSIWYCVWLSALCRWCHKSKTIFHARAYFKALLSHCMWCIWHGQHLPTIQIHNAMQPRQKSIQWTKIG